MVYPPHLFEQRCGKPIRDFRITYHTHMMSFNHINPCKCNAICHLYTILPYLFCPLEVVYCSRDYLFPLKLREVIKSSQWKTMVPSWCECRNGIQILPRGQNNASRSFLLFYLLTACRSINVWRLSKEMMLLWKSTEVSIHTWPSYYYLSLVRQSTCCLHHVKKKYVMHTCFMCLIGIILWKYHYQT